MANGPKKAPIKAQHHVFAPLLSAICQSKNAHAMHIMEIIIAPNINQISLYWTPGFELVAIVIDGEKNSYQVSGKSLRYHLVMPNVPRETVSMQETVFSLEMSSY